MSVSCKAKPLPPRRKAVRRSQRLSSMSFSWNLHVKLAKRLQMEDQSKVPVVQESFLPTRATKAGRKIRKQESKLDTDHTRPQPHLFHLVSLYNSFIKTAKNEPNSRHVSSSNTAIRCCNRNLRQIGQGATHASPSKQLAPSESFSTA